MHGLTAQPSFALYLSTQEYTFVMGRPHNANSYNSPEASHRGYVNKKEAAVTKELVRNSIFAVAAFDNSVLCD